LAGLAALTALSVGFVDEPVARWALPRAETPAVRAFMHVGGIVTTIVAPAVSFGTYAVVGLARRRWRGLWVAGVLAASTLASVLSAGALKGLVARPRPYMAARSSEAGGGLPPSGTDVRSFPSGDVATATCTATVLFLASRWRRGRFASAGLSLVSAAARIVPARHYVSDCLGGLLLGALVTLAFWRLAGPRMAPSADDSRKEPSGT
jgi:undecaprenyl-diphosphatase